MKLDFLETANPDSQKKSYYDSAEKGLMNINGTYIYLYRYLYPNEAYLFNIYYYYYLPQDLPTSRALKAELGARKRYTMRAKTERRSTT